MPLIYITGISGAGKSAVIKELAKQGFAAHDSDEGIAQHYNNETDEIVERPGRDKATSEFYAHHTYKLPRYRIQKLWEEAKDKTVFLCGIVANENEVWDLFDKVIYLDIDEQTLRHRVATRTSNYFGKAPHELENILKWHKGHRKMYEKYGASIIDTNRPLDKVVNEVLKRSTGG
jgi:shikimate kinase